MGRIGVKVIKSYERQIENADTSTQVTTAEAFSAGGWIEPPVELLGLRNLVNDSSILPQCIRAYKNNIAGFGIGIRYANDEKETPEMASEFQMASEIVELLNTECDTKEVFEHIIQARETYGIAYLEVIRNLSGEVAQIDFIEETPSIRKTEPLHPYIETPYCHHGIETMRKKRYCKYKQHIGGKTVYFREFGDPRIMDRRTGEYVDSLELQYQANEILDFAIGTEPYGEIRWIGQVLGVDGSRKAENLNNNYFENGRHTPVAILVKGGTLTDDSFTKLRNYMNGIKGESGQHSFLVLEVENTDSRADFDQSEKPEVEIKDLANILQKDELFQEYLDNNRRRIQSAFLLPDLYTGYTTDFNRATAQTAMEITEKQVFQPERRSLAWIINNKLLNAYKFKYVEVYFKEPDMTNPEDLQKILAVTNNAGGLTPNKAKEILYKSFGEISEDYEGDWGNVPITVSKNLQQIANNNSILSQLSSQIEKSKKASDNNEIVSVMKEVRRILIDIQKQENSHET